MHKAQAVDAMARAEAAERELTELKERRCKTCLRWSPIQALNTTGFGWCDWHDMALTDKHLCLDWAKKGGE